MKGRLGWILRLLFSGGIVLWVLRKLPEPDRVWENLLGLSPLWFLLACAFVILLVSMTAFRWKLLLRAQGIDLSLMTCLKWTFVGYFFNQFLPGINGGDVVKMYYVSEETPMKAAAATSVFVDRVVGLAALMLVCVTGISLNIRFILGEAERSDGPFMEHGLVKAGILAFLFLAVVVFFFALSFSKTLLRLGEDMANRCSKWTIFSKATGFFEIFKKVHRSIFEYRASPATLLAAVALSAMVHVIVVSVNMMVARALGFPDLSWSFFFLLIPVINTVMAVPINVGGCGSREALYYYFFSSAGWAMEQAFSLAVLVYICQLTTSTIGACVWLWARSKRTSKNGSTGGKDDGQGVT